MYILPDNGAVINLESSSFYEQVQDSDRSWLVLFYSSWCGHCINYVPIYTEVANRLQGIVPYFQKQWYGRMGLIILMASLLRQIDNVSVYDKVAQRLLGTVLSC